MGQELGQIEVLGAVPVQGRCLFFFAAEGDNVDPALKVLAKRVEGEPVIVGTGVPGLRPFPARVAMIERSWGRQDRSICLHRISNI